MLTFLNCHFFFMFIFCLIQNSDNTSTVSSISPLSDPRTNHGPVWHAVRGRLLPLPFPMSPRLPHPPSAGQTDHHRTQHGPLQPQFLPQWQSLPQHPGVSRGSGFPSAGFQPDCEWFSNHTQFDFCDFCRVSNCAWTAWTTLSTTFGFDSHWRQFMQP